MYTVNRYGMSTDGIFLLLTQRPWYPLRRGEGAFVKTSPHFRLGYVVPLLPPSPSKNQLGSIREALSQLSCGVKKKKENPWFGFHVKLYLSLG